jgi:hypothetical protein
MSTVTRCTCADYLLDGPFSSPFSVLAKVSYANHSFESGDQICGFADSLVLASTGLRELLLTQSSCHISLRERESHLHRDLRFTNLDGYFRF